MPAASARPPNRARKRTTFAPARTRRRYEPTYRHAGATCTSVTRTVVGRAAWNLSASRFRAPARPRDPREGARDVGRPCLEDARSVLPPDAGCALFDGVAPGADGTVTFGVGADTVGVATLGSVGVAGSVTVGTVTETVGTGGSCPSAAPQVMPRATAATARTTDAAWRRIFIREGNGPSVNSVADDVWPTDDTRNTTRVAQLERDFYEILGVPPDAEASVIRKAYHALARAHHPDASGDPEADERFNEVARAYEILSDPESRELYDTFREPRRGSGQGPTTEELVERILRLRSRRRGEDVVAEALATARGTRDAGDSRAVRYAALAGLVLAVVFLVVLLFVA